MNLKTIIQPIIESIGLQFAYGTKYDANIFTDASLFPIGVLLEPDSGGFLVTKQTGALRDSRNIFIQFITQKRMAESADDRESEMEEMITYAAKFISALNNLNEFNDIAPDGYRWIKIVDVYDSNVVGIELNIPALTYITPRPC